MLRPCYRLQLIIMGRIEKSRSREPRERVTIDPEIVFEQQRRNTGGVYVTWRQGRKRQRRKEEERGGKRTRGKLNLAEYLSPDQRCSRRLFTDCACRPTFLKYNKKMLSSPSLSSSSSYGQSLLSELSNTHYSRTKLQCYD